MTTSVAVSSWTLVAISCERYYAICHPLRSRTWQTINHAYKIIGFIWMGSFVCMSPIAGFSQLIPTSQGLRKCREYWPEDAIVYERTYNILLDFILLILPLVVLCVAYILITRTLYTSMGNENLITKNSFNGVSGSVTFRQGSIDRGRLQQYDELRRNKFYPENSRSINFLHRSSVKPLDRWHERSITQKSHSMEPSPPPPTVTEDFSVLRKTNISKSLENKRRVVKMLFVLVLEFFICWTPLYVINTITLFNPAVIYQNIGYTAISFLQLLAYSSSCCNPITYCFMNAGFRKAFLDTFKGIHGPTRCWRKLNKTNNGTLDSPKIELGDAVDRE